MTLDAAGQIIETNPRRRAGLLLYEARDSLGSRPWPSFRALVRGIHPPVLADRAV